MKQSYNIELAGVSLNIVTEDGAEFVEATVAELNESVQNMLQIGKQFSKLDAALFCALDYCAEYRKAEAKIKNLEAQIEILEAGRRMRGESEDESVPDEAPAVEETAEETADEIEETEETEAQAEADEESRDEKFRQLEALLGSQLKFDLGND